MTASVSCGIGRAHDLISPIIFTVLKGSKVHFNAGHFLRIKWEDAQDLRTQLTQRIRDLPELQK